MDPAPHNWLHRAADTLETRLFGANPDLTEDQLSYFRTIFTPESYDLTKNFAKYFKQELCLGYIFNILLFTILIAYLPFNFFDCMACNPSVTVWFLVLSTLNSIVILPKTLLIIKLFRIEELGDLCLANYAIWGFFKSKIYRFNTMVSKYVLCTYVLGLFLEWRTQWLENEELHRFHMIVMFFLGSFVVRLFSGFTKFMRNFGNPQQAENLADLFNGNSGEEIQTLKQYIYQDYKNTTEKEDDECPICYEPYEEKDKIRVMKCQGRHAFHRMCIDKWLIRSDRCPKCNCSVFWKDEEDKKND